MNTAIIIRPNTYPPPQVLECDGPQTMPRVNRYPGSYAKNILSFDEWNALPPHLKNAEQSAESIDRNSACRIVRLLDNARSTGVLPAAHMSEILRRMEMLFPYCAADLIATPRKFA